MSKQLIVLPKDAVKAAEPMVADKWKENFLCLYLDARNYLKKGELISFGTINCNIVHPREVFRPALISRAVGIIVLHNHPSGDSSPSAADVELTERLKKVADIFGIDLIDHIIFTPKGEYYSFRDEQKI